MTAEAPFVRPDPEVAAKALTAHAPSPRLTVPLVLASVAVAVLAMHVDAVARYAFEAFWFGVFATAGLAWVVARVVAAQPAGRARTALAVALPTLGGAFVGVVIQVIVWKAWDASGGWAGTVDPVRDLQGLIDTTDVVTWTAGGIVLGAAPALAVSAFLVLAARAIKRLTGHDAAEEFSVVFTGAAGLLGALALLVVEPQEAAPLVFVVGAAFVSLVVVFLVDGARLRFLRQAWAGADGAFEVVPAERFASGGTLAPFVAKGGRGGVLVKIDRRPGSYRGAAAEPVALVGGTEDMTTRPLRRSRTAAAAMLAAMTALGGFAALAHAIFV